MDQINKDVAWADISHRQSDPAKFPDFKWTDENTEELKRLTAKGDSSAQIALELGTTRNSVIGKWNRLGIQVPKSLRYNVLTPDERKARHADNQRNSYKSRRDKERKYLLALVSDPAAVVPLNIAFVDLEPHHCRYPLASGESGFLFCGLDKFSDSSYCGHHHQIAYMVRA